jgi:hypothetical protein
MESMPDMSDIPEVPELAVMPGIGDVELMPDIDSASAIALTSGVGVVVAAWS